MPHTQGEVVTPRAVIEVRRSGISLPEPVENEHMDCPPTIDFSVGIAVADASILASPDPATITGPSPSKSHVRFLHQARSELEHFFASREGGSVSAHQLQKLESVSKWVRRADETWSYQAEKLSEQIAQQHQRALRAETALSESRAHAKTLDEQLVHLREQIHLQRND